MKDTVLSLANQYLTEEGQFQIYMLLEEGKIDEAGLYIFATLTARCHWGEVKPDELESVRKLLGISEEREKELNAEVSKRFN